MAKTFYLEIIASDHKFFEGQCEQIIFPSIDGSYGVLPGHEATVTALDEGELQYMTDGEWHYAAVSDGIVQILPEKVTILADTVEKPEEIDAKRAQEAKERAQEKLRQKQSMKEYYLTQASLNRAINRLRVTQRHK